MLVLARLSQVVGSRYLFLFLDRPAEILWILMILLYGQCAFFLSRSVRFVGSGSLDLVCALGHVGCNLLVAMCFEILILICWLGVADCPFVVAG